MTSKDWTQTISNSFQDLWGSFIGVVPDIIGAILIFIVGWVLGNTLGVASKRLVHRLKVDEMAQKLGVTDFFRHVDIKVSFSSIIGAIVKWFIIIVFLVAAADILGWSEVNTFLRSIALYIPNIIVAVIILTIGLLVSKFVEGAITQALDTADVEGKQAVFLAKSGRIAVIVFATMAALQQLGIAARLVEILFTGMVFALALAFGLGGREKAAELLRNVGKPQNRI